MNQQQLDRAVARVTGESIETIQRHGFIPINVNLRPRRRGRRRRRARNYRAFAR
jgi:hypothetical protein